MRSRSGWLNVLRALDKSGKPASARQIAATFGVHPSTVRTLLERSRTYGTVRRAGKDGNVVLYEITDVGVNRIKWEDEKP
jgi:DNA-binding IclR family transcriptional regulator